MRNREGRPLIPETKEEMERGAATSPSVTFSFSVKTSDGKFNSTLTIPVSADAKQYSHVIGAWLKLMHEALRTDGEAQPAVLRFDHKGCGGKWSIVDRVTEGDYKDVDVFRCDKCGVNTTQPDSEMLDNLLKQARGEKE